MIETPSSLTPLTAATEPRTSSSALLGRYPICEVKQGGMGEVFICRFRFSESVKIAYKTFHRSFFFHPRVRNAFIREARIWMRLQNPVIPHVMPLHSVEKDGVQLFLGMIALEHNDDKPLSLRDAIQQRTLSITDILSIAIQISRGMTLSINRIENLVHGDLKPDNILFITRRTKTVVISDFGLAQAAHELGDEGLESTWAYLAPEVFSSGVRTQSSDIYAFGIMMYETLSGRRPFKADSKREWERLHIEKDPPRLDELNDEISIGLEMIILRCLRKEPDQRPSSFVELESLLTNLADNKSPESLSLADKSFSICTTLSIFQFTIPWSLDVEIRSMINLGMLEEALDRLSDISEEDYRWNIYNMKEEYYCWHPLFLKGRVFLEMGRYEEALSCFEQVIEYDIPENYTEGIEETIIDVYHLMAVTSIGIGKLDYAHKILNFLLRVAPEDKINLIVNTISALYLQMNQPAKAALVLRSFDREVRDTPEAWCNLAEAHLRLGNLTVAEAAVGRSLMLRPGYFAALLLRCDILLHNQERVSEALHTLDAILLQGSAGRQYLLRALCCHLMLGMNSKFLDLIQIAHDVYDDHEVEEICLKSKLLADAVRSGHPLTVLYPQIDEPNHDPEASVEDEIEPIRLPHMTFTVDSHTDFWTLSFYHHTADPNFAIQFAEMWKYQSRMIRLFAGPNGIPQAGRLLFTDCSVCRITILGNFKEGEEVVCDRCRRKFRVIPNDASHLESILHKVEAVLGLELVDLSGYRQVAMFQLFDPKELEIVESIAKSHDFEPIQDNDFIVEFFFFLSIYNRKMLPNLPARGFSKIASEGSHVYNIAPWDTPTDMIKLLEDVRLQVKSGVNSFGVYLDPEGEAAHTPESLESKYISRFKQTLDPSELYHVVMFKVSRGDLQGADEYLDKMRTLTPNSVETWIATGILSVARNEFIQAEEAFRHALKLDPTSMLAAFCLSHCLLQQGDEVEADRWLVRSRELGYVL